MVTQADIPSYLTDDDKAYTFQYLDANLNSGILYALLNGIYTGILAVSLWNILLNQRWPIRRALVVVIIILHALTTITFAAKWSYMRSAFVGNGQSFWTVYLKLDSLALAVYWEMGIAASVSSILADSYMMWCCWMVWGRRWLIVLLPILTLISATVLRIIGVYRAYFSLATEECPLLYLASLLVTTLWCTLLIIYRILTVAGVRRGAEGRLRLYRRFIQVLVESLALYSISLILYLAFVIHGGFEVFYLDAIGAIAKGVAPTLLVGRAAAGHTQPKDDYDESTVSSLHFQAPSEVGTTSFQESTTESSVLEIDIEAQQQHSDELVVVVERM